MKRYPEYKESGVEWIGEIPQHWKIERIKHIATLVSEKSTPETDAVKISPENVESKTGKVLDFYSLYDAVGVKFQAGDILFNKLRVYLSKVVFAECDGYSLSEMIVMRPSLQGAGKYLFYFMLSSRFIEYCDSISYGAKMPRTAVDDILNAQIPITSDKEQKQIASFLDRKTEQIDELIHIKKRKIELLQEQRTALINQVVTKGLDPNVEMKPSGVEWIEEIPRHWEVNRLKYIAKILPSNVDKHIYPDEIQVRLCNYTDVYYNDYITVDTVLKKGSCKESEFAKFVLRKGDVIITKDSETPDDIGVPTFVKDDLNSIVCGYHLTMIRPLVCRGEFIFRFIQSDRTRRYFELESNGITRYGLGKPSIENLCLPIPPDSEQRQIADFLDHKTKQIDELITTEQRKIELLKEYRQSLISEAVTGKIDVRNKV